MKASRREFLRSTTALAVAPWFSGCGDGAESDEESAPSGPFRHGVASGDPLPDSIILWTRVSPEASSTEVAVTWQIARDPALSEVVQDGTLSSDASRDFTVKVDVRELEPGTTYYYRFAALGVASPVGRTRTAARGDLSRLRLALVSCSNYPAGYFNAYAAIAARADLDAVLHLGDYIYEYGPEGFGSGGVASRVHAPPIETLSLSGYRERHAQYKGDPDLQEAHRQHPFIAVWDDHEVANDAFESGAENHDPSEGDWEARRQAAQQAYFEWMPIRAGGEENQVYRSFRFGDLADLVMLDTRHAGRAAQPSDACDADTVNDPERQLLGKAQEAWLEEELSRSQDDEVRWRLIGQQVMFAPVRNPLTAMCPLNIDQWDGYGAARERVFDMIEGGAIDNVVILTGDIHSSWAHELSREPFDAEQYDPETGAGSLAVEIVAPAVSSPGIEDLDTALRLAELARNTHPHVKYAELFHRGYVLLDVTEDAVQAEWYHFETVRERRIEASLAAAFRVENGRPHLIQVEFPQGG